MSPSATEYHSTTEFSNGTEKHFNGKNALFIEPLKPTGILDQFRSFNVTPVIGKEFPEAHLVDWLRAPNSDELLRELAITISRRGVVFFRSQNGLTDELQKVLVQRLGELSGKPASSSLHVHPLSHFNKEKDKNVNIITTDKAALPAEDIFKSHNERPLGTRGAWHTDIGYEPYPSDYTCLRLTQLPQTGGDTMWASSYEVYDKISPAYRTFLESLTGTFGQQRYPKTAAEKNFQIYSDERGSPHNVGTLLQTTHPVVRTNPVTGWKSLMGVGNHLVRYNELTKSEGDRMHDWLLQMIVENIDVQLRHRWQNVNDVAIWDNRSTFHAANMDFAGLGERTGNRVVGIGESPYLDPNSKTRRQALDASG